jgi:preprotein translocase SecE subunit
VTKKQVRSLKKGSRPSGGKPVREKAASEKKPAAVKSTAQETPVLSVPARFVQFLRDVRVEFDKISWANRKETVTLTIATVSLTFFIASYLGLVDIILSKIVGLLIK